MTHKNRIVLIATKFPTISETFIVSKFQGLLNAGWDVFVLCGVFEKSVAKTHYPHLYRTMVRRTYVWNPWATGSGWMFHPKRWPLVRFSLSRNGFSQLLVHWKMKCLKSLKPDIVHYEFGILAKNHLFIMRNVQCKHTVSFRGYDIESVGLEYPDFYRDVWILADAIHVLGKDIESRARNRGMGPHARVFHIPPGIDVDHFCVRNRSSHATIQITTIARLVWKKGLSYALEAISMLKERGYCFEYHIVGSGDHRRFLEWLIDFYRIGDCVRLCGEQSRAWIQEQLHATDIFVMPSVSEGFCNAVLEAQGTGIPVVCSDACGLPENVVHGETGLVVPRRSALQLADAIALLIDQPALRTRMGLQGRKRVVQHFTIEQNIQKWDHMYRSLLGLPLPGQANTDVVMSASADCARVG